MEEERGGRQGEGGRGVGREPRLYLPLVHLKRLGQLQPHRPRRKIVCLKDRLEESAALRVGRPAALGDARHGRRRHRAARSPAAWAVLAPGRDSGDDVSRRSGGPAQSRGGAGRGVWRAIASRWWPSARPRAEVIRETCERWCGARHGTARSAAAGWGERAVRGGRACVGETAREGPRGRLAPPELDTLAAPAQKSPCGHLPTPAARVALAEGSRGFRRHLW